MKSDRAKELFRIRAARKMGLEQFGRARSEAKANMLKKRGGGGERRKPFFPLPHPAPSTFFALAPLFARSECEKALSRGPIFIRLVRERLLVGYSRLYTSDSVVSVG